MFDVLESYYNKWNNNYVTKRYYYRLFAKLYVVELMFVRNEYSAQKKQETLAVVALSPRADVLPLFAMLERSENDQRKFLSAWNSLSLSP